MNVKLLVHHVTSRLLKVSCGCKGFTTSVLSQTSCTVVSNVTLQAGDLLTESPTQHEWCEESSLKFNIIKLSLDVIQYILFTVVGLYLYII